MATPTPSGKATSADQNEITSVPTTSGWTPKWAGSKSGAHVVPLKNSQTDTSRKNSRAGRKSERTIPIVVRTEIAAATKSTAWTRSSPGRILFRGSTEAAGRPAVTSVDVI